jgi:ribosomal protein S19
LPFVHSVFFKKRLLLKELITVKLRHSLIPNHFIGKRAKIYNGIWYLTINIMKNMFGFKFGQFAFTKKGFDPLRPKRPKKTKAKRR